MVSGNYVLKEATDMTTTTRNTIAQLFKDLAERLESKPEIELVPRNRMLPAEVAN